MYFTESFISQNGIVFRESLRHLTSNSYVTSNVSIKSKLRLMVNLYSAHLFSRSQNEEFCLIKIAPCELTF